MKPLRKLFISDIHGYYYPMVELLKRANYQPDKDKLIVGGDMINRGPDSALVVKQLRSLQIRYPDNVTILAGNHEDMITLYILGKSTIWTNHWDESIKSFNQVFTEDEFKNHIAWLTERPFLVGDEEYIYVHAGIDPHLPLSKQNRLETLWMPHTNKKQRFTDYDIKDILKCTGNRKVIYGHTPRNYVFDDGARICCDLGAGKNDGEPKLALVNLTGDTYWYYDFATREIKHRRIARKKN